MRVSGSGSPTVGHSVRTHPTGIGVESKVGLERRTGDRVGRGGPHGREKHPTRSTRHTPPPVHISTPYPPLTVSLVVVESRPGGLNIRSGSTRIRAPHTFTCFVRRDTNPPSRSRVGPCRVLLTDRSHSLVTDDTPTPHLGTVIPVTGPTHWRWSSGSRPVGLRLGVTPQEDTLSLPCPSPTPGHGCVS